MWICRSVLVGCLGIVSGFSRDFPRVALGMPCDFLWALFRSCPTFVVGCARSSWGSFRMPLGFSLDVLELS